MRPPRAGTALHPLSAASRRRLTDDAVAITFAVPDELRDDYRFDAGAAPHRAHRRSTAPRCAAPTRSARPATQRPAARRREAARRRGVLRHSPRTALRRRRRARRDDARRRFGRRWTPARPSATPPSRRAAASPRCCRSSPTVLDVEPESTLHPGLRQPHDAGRSMFLEELADLKDRYPDAVPRSSTCSPASRRTSSCSPAGSTRDRLGRLLATLLSPADRSTSGSCAGRSRWSSRPRERAASSRGVAGRARPPRAVPRRGRPPRERRRRLDAARRRQRRSPLVLDGRRHDVRRAATAASHPGRRAARRAPDAPYACKGGVCGTCRASSSTGEVRWTATTRWSRTRSRRASCWPASRTRADEVVLDFDQWPGGRLRWRL